jgi:hypothetical protein
MKKSSSCECFKQDLDNMLGGDFGSADPSPPEEPGDAGKDPAEAANPDKPEK